MAVGKGLRLPLILLALLFLLIVVAEPGLPAEAEIGVIHVYQRVGSPVMKYMARCRFQPSCSHYSVQALHEHGFLVGNVLIGKRLFLCSPIGYFLAGSE